MSDLEDVYAAGMDAEIDQRRLEAQRAIIRMEVETDRQRRGQGSSLLTIKASAQLEQRIAAFMVRERIWNRSRALRVLLAYALNDLKYEER
jgi:hypothetical protein